MSESSTDFSTSAFGRGFGCSNRDCEHGFDSQTRGSGLSEQFCGFDSNGGEHGGEHFDCVFGCLSEHGSGGATSGGASESNDCDSSWSHSETSHGSRTTGYGYDTTQRQFSCGRRDGFAGRADAFSFASSTHFAERGFGFGSRGGASRASFSTLQSRLDTGGWSCFTHQTTPERDGYGRDRTSETFSFFSARLASSTGGCSCECETAFFGRLLEKSTVGVQNRQESLAVLI